MAYEVKLEQWLTRQRIYMQDASKVEWTDLALTQFINDAIVLHTTEVPYAAMATITCSNGVHEYTLPVDFVAAKLVKGQFGTATDVFVPIGYLGEGDVWAWQTGSETRTALPHFPQTGKIYFPYAPTSNCVLYYWKRLAGTLVNPTDKIDLLDRAWSEMAIRALTGYLAFWPGAAYRALLEQWARRQDLNVDNPLEQEANRYLRAYDDLLRRHTAVAGIQFAGGR